jgi:serine/threonine protein phosphatase 1
MTEQRYYVFPDIHGCDDLLDQALSFVYKNNPNGGKIIFLGDYIDRGPDNKRVIETVMYPPPGWEFVCLMGNHEDMFIDAYERKDRLYDFNVFVHFCPPSIQPVTYDKAHAAFPKEVLEWMKGLKKFHFEDDNVFAHAFYDDTYPPGLQSSGSLLWTRMDDWMSFPSKDNRLFLTHGHTPRKHGPVKSPNRVNLDCGAVFYGRFVIGEYYEGVKGPTDFHEFTTDRWTS